jgi:hypothetical protein
MTVLGCPLSVAKCAPPIAAPSLCPERRSFYLTKRRGTGVFFDTMLLAMLASLCCCRSSNRGKQQGV